MPRPVGEMRISCKEGLIQAGGLLWGCSCPEDINTITYGIQKELHTAVSKSYYDDKTLLNFQDFCIPSLTTKALVPQDINIIT